MFYIGFRDEAHAQIGIARQQGRHHRTGSGIRPIRSSARARTNGTTTPATSPTPSSTARNGCSGTTAATAGLEQIGVVIHEGEDLGFDLNPAPRRTEKRPCLTLRFFVDI